MDASTEKTNVKTQENSYLKNQMLIAMPNLGDPIFEQTVTLICQHNEDGCFGLTINRPMQVSLEELFDQLDIPTKGDTLDNKIKDMKAMSGGPVQIEQGFIVHDASNPENKTWENTIEIGDDLFVTASRDILFDIGMGIGPKNFLLTLGCASWGAGQMEQEVLSNAWLNCPTDKKIIFDTPYEKRWNKSVDTLGIDINLISHVAGHA